MRSGLAATFAAVALSLILAAPASAYVRSRSNDGTLNLIWADARLTITVETGGPEVVPVDDFLTAAMRSAATWSDPTLGSSVFITVAHSADPPVGALYDQQNTISFRTDSWDPPDYLPGQLAVTTVWTIGGRIVDTDTEINAVTPGISWAVLPDDVATFTDVDLENALTHELGHVLGLDHPCYLGAPPDPPEVTNEGGPVPSCSDPALPASVLGATMFPSSRRGDIAERTLSPDEALALHDLYPAGSAPIVEGDHMNEGGGGCAVASGRHAAPDAAPSKAALLAAALGLVFARRRSAARAAKERRRVHLA